MLRDVAALAQVDPSTVSRVLRNDPAQKVRPETRQRILDAARELGYRPNAQARSLRVRATQIIALVVPSLDNIGFTAVAHGVQEAAGRLGYLVILADAEALAGDEELYGRLMLEQRIDGLLVAFAGMHDHLIARLVQRNIPLVLINRRSAGVRASVIVDDLAGSKLAIQHLLDLGHRRIAFIGGRPNTDTTRRRARGVHAALEAAGLKLDPRLTAAGHYSEEGGYAAAGALLRRWAQPATAVYAANLVSGLGALRRFSEAGLRVPEDISLIVMDEHPVADYTNPPLTTVAMPLFEMGAEAARMLIGAFSGGPLAQVVIGAAPEIVARASTAPPAA